MTCRFLFTNTQTTQCLILICNLSMLQNCKFMHTVSVTDARNWYFSDPTKGFDYFGKCLKTFLANDILAK